MKTNRMWLKRAAMLSACEMINNLKTYVFLGVMFIAVPLMADTEYANGYTWTYIISGNAAHIYNKTGEVTAGVAVSPKPTGTVTVPSVLGGKPVVAIRNWAFYRCDEMTSVIIPDSVTSIDTLAFGYCGSLQSIVIGNNPYYEIVSSLLLTKDGRYLVVAPGGLSHVSIPTCVNIIDVGAFRGNSSLETVTIPSSVKKINGAAFAHSINLKSVSIPNGVTTIESSTFSECISLQSVTIPDSVTTIENWAFKKCSSLVSVPIPDSVNSIGVGAFSGCSGLTSMTIPSDVTSIEANTFYGCSGLTSVNIPDGVTSIGDAAFYGCSSLTSMTIPSSVTFIGDYAFYNCRSLDRIVFAGSPPQIGGDKCFFDISSNACGYYQSRFYDAWQEAMDSNGYWNGLKMKMKLGASINVAPTAMNWVSNASNDKGLTIGWTWSANEDEDATPPASYSIYYSDNTNSYDTANVVVEGLSGLLRSYKDSQYLDRLDGLKPVCYFVVGSDGSVGVCQTRNRHGIFVGLNEWENPGLKPIGGDKNANDFSNIAMRRGGFPLENIYTLTNQDANADAVDAAFDDVAAKAKSGDVCLFYFSTHGGVDSEDAILCLYDEDYTDKRIARKIAAIDSEVAIVGIISACHSGGLYDTNPLWDEWYVTNNLAQCSPNIAWLSSSDVANTAYGVFDKFLLEYGWEKGWAGTDEMISFNDLASYTKEQYDTLFSGTILKDEKRSKTAQIEDTGGLLSSIVAGRRGGHETSIRKPSAPNNVDVKTGLYLNQLDVTLQPVADADEYCIFLLCEDGSYEKIWTPSAKHLQTIDVDHSSVILSNKEFSDTSLQVLIKAVNGAGVSQAVTSERKELVTITFDGNGGEVGNWRGAESFKVSAGYYVVFGDVSVGSKLLALPSAGTYSVTGYEFKGWFDEYGIEATPETVVSRSTVYSAQWEHSVPEPEFNTDENGTLTGIDYDGATEITIPDTVTSIASGAFGYNSKLERVTIPASVNSIHAYAFDNCSGLTAITVAEDNPHYKSVNGLLLTKDGKTLVQGVNGDVIIPLGVTKIGDSAFYGCSGLTNVTIPESVKAIEEYGFGECTSLASVIIPSNVARIGDYAFSDCEALETVEFEGNRDAIEMDIQNIFVGTPWLVSTLPKPENDNYEAAILLSGDSGRITGTNVGATSENIESELGLGRATIWWKWSATASCKVAFDTLGSLFDTILGVYVETEDGIAEIAYNDDCDESNEYESRVTFNAEKGTMYYIVASGYDSNMGTIFLNWEPYSDTPIPEVTNVSEIESALAGSADTNLSVNITSMAFYDAYRTWATGLEANNVSALAVKRSPYTWLSFALAADMLINKELTSDDVTIESFTPASTDGKFELTVSVKDINIGGGSVTEETLKENLKKVLGIEGAATLSPGGFSSDNIDITFDTPVDGKARFTITPPVDAGSSFFMRVKIK